MVFKNQSIEKSFQMKTQSAYQTEKRIESEKFDMNILKEKLEDRKK